LVIGQYCNVTIPLSAVKALRSTTDNRVQVELLDGDTETYASSEIDTALSNTIQTTFPADGAQWLTTLHDEQGKPEDVEARTILAFAIDARGELVAITRDGIVDEPTILFADGHVEYYEQRWDTLDAYKAQLTGKKSLSSSIEVIG